MNGHQMAEVAGAVGIFLLLITVVTVTIWQVSATRRAKLRLDREYAVLAERSAAEREHAETELVELRSRVEAVERILKEVE